MVCKVRKEARDLHSKEEVDNMLTKDENRVKYLVVSRRDIFSRKRKRRQ
jgi:hypothetical protein